MTTEPLSIPLSAEQINIIVQGLEEYKETLVNFDGCEDEEFDFDAEQETTTKLISYFTTILEEIFNDT